MRFSLSKRSAAIRLSLAIVVAAALMAAVPATRVAAGPHSGGGHMGYRGHGYGGHFGPSHVRYPHHSIAPRQPGYRHAYYGPGYGYPYRRAYGPRLGFGISIGSLRPPGYYYYDPYCDLEFESLVLYRDHLYDHGHPWRVRVIAVGGGYPVATFRYRGGGWVGCY